MEEKIDKLTKALETLSVQIGQNFEKVDQRFEKMDMRFDVLEWSLKDTREDLGRRIDETHHRIDKGFDKLDGFVLHLERHDHELVAHQSAIERLET